MPLPRLLHYPVFMPTPAWNSSSLETNVIIPSQNYKYSSWHHFPYSQVNWWSSFTCQRSLMAQVIKYSHIGSQQGRIRMQVQAGRLRSEGGMGGVRPSWMMWSSPGPMGINNFFIYVYICKEKLYCYNTSLSGKDDLVINSWRKQYIAGCFQVPHFECQNLFFMLVLFLFSDK